MSVEENKEIIKKVFEEYNKGNYSVIDEYFADNFQIVRNSGVILDKNGYKNFTAMILKGIPDIQRTMGDMVAEGDNIAFNFTWTGTDTGGIGDSLATGKHFTMKEAYFCRLENGKIVEFKQYSDTLVMLQQGGILPTTPEILKSYNESR